MKITAILILVFLFIVGVSRLRLDRNEVEHWNESRALESELMSIVHPQL